MDISQVYLALKSKILENRDITVIPKSVVSDIFLMPTATEITKLRILVSFVSGLQSFESITNIITNTSFLTNVAEALDITVDQVNILIDGAMDKLAANYDKTRKTATAATGFINLYRPDIPPVGTLSTLVPLGTTAQTPAGISYTTTQEVPYSDYYYDAVLGAYVLDVPTQCTTVGSIGNCPDGSITILTTPVTGWGNVTNLVEISNALDLETTTDFANRLKREIAGNNVGTRKGIESVILQNFPQVSDIIVAGPGDPIMYRDMGWGGKLDIYALEKSYARYDWNFGYNGEDITYITGPRPISAANSVTPSEGTLTFTRDTTSVFVGSNLSKDFVTWTVKPVGPYPKTVTLSYYYDKNITDVQSFMNQDAYYTGADILIKQATEVPVDIVCEVQVTTGYSKDTVKSQISALLTSNIDALRLGQSLQQSDTIAWMYQITGVDKVTLPMIKFNRSSITTGTMVLDTISVSKNEYIRLSTLSLNMI